MLLHQNEPRRTRHPKKSVQKNGTPTIDWSRIERVKPPTIDWSRIERVKPPTIDWSRIERVKPPTIDWSRIERVKPPTIDWSRIERVKPPTIDWSRIERVDDHKNTINEPQISDVKETTSYIATFYGTFLAPLTGIASPFIHLGLQMGIQGALVAATGGLSIPVTIASGLIVEVLCSAPSLAKKGFTEGLSRQDFVNLGWQLGTNALSSGSGIFIGRLVKPYAGVIVGEIASGVASSIVVGNGPVDAKNNNLTPEQEAQLRAQLVMQRLQQENKQREDKQTDEEKLSWLNRNRTRIFKGLAAVTMAASLVATYKNDTGRKLFKGAFWFYKNNQWFRAGVNANVTNQLPTAKLEQIANTITDKILEKVRLKDQTIVPEFVKKRLHQRVQEHLIMNLTVGDLMQRINKVALKTAGHVATNQASDRVKEWNSLEDAQRDINNARVAMAERMNQLMEQAKDASLSVSATLNELKKTWLDNVPTREERLQTRQDQRRHRQNEQKNFEPEPDLDPEEERLQDRNDRLKYRQIGRQYRLDNQDFLDVEPDEPEFVVPDIELDPDLDDDTSLDDPKTKPDPPKEKPDLKPPILEPDPPKEKPDLKPPILEPDPPKEKPPQEGKKVRFKSALGHALDYGGFWALGTVTGSIKGLSAIGKMAKNANLFKKGAKATYWGAQGISVGTTGDFATDGSNLLDDAINLLDKVDGYFSLTEWITYGSGYKFTYDVKDAATNIGINAAAGVFSGSTWSNVLTSDGLKQFAVGSGRS
jgi:hypothetical protein